MSLLDFIQDLFEKQAAATEMSKGGRKISRFPFRTFSGDFLEVFGTNQLTRINFRIKIIALVFVASKAQSNISLYVSLYM